MSDNSDIIRIQKRMQECTRKLHQMAPALGIAKQVKEFSSDQRKMALATEMVKALKAGESAAAADATARASEAYARALATLATQYAEAERVIAENHATVCSFDAARSLLAMNRESMRQLEG